MRFLCGRADFTIVVDEVHEVSGIMLFVLVERHMLVLCPLRFCLGFRGVFTFSLFFVYDRRHGKYVDDGARELGLSREGAGRSGSGAC